MKLLTIMAVISTIFCIPLNAQSTSPVKWTFKVEKVNEHTFDLIAKADMDEKWVIYSQHSDPDGPVPTYFEFTSMDNIELVGSVEEDSDKMVQYSDLFEVEVSKFKDEAIFRQRFTSNLDVPRLSGIVTYMTCDSKKCLPPKDVPFEVTL